VEDVINFKSDFANLIFGPIFVNGSEPGDVLKVEFLDLQCASYGWTAILKGFGIIAEDFPDPYLKIWDLSQVQVEKGYAVLKEGIHIPIRPFLGVVGVAPGEAGEFSTIPPLDTGGNIDCNISLVVRLCISRSEWMAHSFHVATDMLLRVMARSAEAQLRLR
jgi:acetamidase/formamidase